MRSHRDLKGWISENFRRFWWKLFWFRICYTMRGYGVNYPLSLIYCYSSRVSQNFSRWVMTFILFVIERSSSAPCKSVFGMIFGQKLTILQPQKVENSIIKHQKIHKILLKHRESDFEVPLFGFSLRTENRVEWDYK